MERILNRVPRVATPGEAARHALEGSREDACLVYLHGVDGVRLAGAAAADRTVDAELQRFAREPAPLPVMQVLRSGLPRVALCRRADGQRMPILDGWPAAEVAGARHVLITTLEADLSVCGALVVIRSGAAAEWYSELDVAVFRLLGLWIPSRLRA